MLYIIVLLTLVYCFIVGILSKKYHYSIVAGIVFYFMITFPMSSSALAVGFGALFFLILMFIFFFVGASVLIVGYDVIRKLILH